MKKLLKLGAIALAAVAGLGAGYTLAAMLMARVGDRLSEKARGWLTAFTAFVTGLVAAVAATKLASKFLGAGGPGVSASIK